MSYAYAPAAAPARPFHRPALVALLAVLIGILGVIVLVVGILALIAGALLGGLAFGTMGAVLGGAVGAVVLIAGAVTLVAAKGLWGMQSWAWWLSVIIVGLMLLFASSLLGMVVLGLLLVYFIAVRKHFNQ